MKRMLLTITLFTLISFGALELPREFVGDLPTAIENIVPEASANSRGQCNTEAFLRGNTINIVISSLKKEGVFRQTANYARRHWSYRPSRDGGFAEFLRENARLVRLPKGVTVKNNGCRNGHLFSAGSRFLGTGTRVWVITPLKYRGKDIRFSQPANTAGWDKTKPTHKTGFQWICINPIDGDIRLPIWKRIPNANIGIVKDAVDSQGTALEPTDPRVLAADFNFVVKANGQVRDIPYDAPIGTKVSAGKCRVGTMVDADEVAIDGWITPGAQRARCTRKGVTFTFVNKLCPPELPVILRVSARKAGKPVSVPAGAWKYEVLVDDVSQGIFTNARSGRQKTLLKVDRSQEVTVRQLPEPRGSRWFWYRPVKGNTRTKTADRLSVIANFPNTCRRETAAGACSRGN